MPKIKNLDNLKIFALTKTIKQNYKKIKVKYPKRNDRSKILCEKTKRTINIELTT